MNILLRRTQDLWIKAQLKAPAAVDRSIMPRLHEAKEIARLLTNPYLPVRLLQGQAHTGPITVSYVGLQFFEPFLKSVLFETDPFEQHIKRIPVWRCKEITDLQSDLIVVEAAKHLIRRLPQQNAIITPEFVEHELGVSGEWEEVQRRLRKRMRDEIRLTRKYGYQYKISRNAQDFKKFYYDMYLPTVHSRHKDAASPMPLRQAFEYFRYGLLFLVERDGRRVCGLVCHLKHDTVRLMVMGIVNGDKQLLKEGAADALYYLLIQWANLHGYQAISFLGSGTRLNSGLFQYKRKWGTTISVSNTLHRQIWIKIQRNTPAAVQFLKDNPFVIIDRDGKLHGLIIVDDLHQVSAETREEWEKRYVTPGLSSLVVRSVSNLFEKPADGHHSDLVIPIRITPTFDNG
jgi:hypothetical protein